MDEGKKEILRYAGTFIALVVVFYGGTMVMRSSLGTSNPMMVVISQSMVPNLGVGDFIFIQSIEDFDDVKIGAPPDGDVLVFHSPRNHDEFIVHRAIDSTYVDGRWVYQTKGDFNQLQDNFLVDEALVVGRVINRLPIVGYFSLFIKTMKGFGFVLALMGVSFFYDNILPKKEEESCGQFNILSVAPFLVAPYVVVKLWFDPSNHEYLEMASLLAWYAGSIMLPLSTEDDDMGLMFWLYHLVLLMIPLMCDLSWWRTHITPSNWWTTQGSTVPISWLLMQETPMFTRTFWQIVTWLGPGIVFFLGLLYAKRVKIGAVDKLSDFMRGVEEES